ncbi:arginine--tRNA ligase [candidate division KSB1 bacterium]|nr:arginine--tRNA ligase [candidate division KSB1 bacterium]MBL7092613.1 arginine--tRNA ligase [candidate division KSB1 bacterium]
MKNIQEILGEIITNALQQLNVDIDKYKIILERPKQENHGDWSVNIAMQLASVLKKAPRQIAEEIKNNIPFDSGLIEKIEIAGPGFINFYLGWDYFREALGAIIQQKQNYGQTDWGKNEKLQIEFVSANPTGPLNVVSARAATIGDIMVNLYNAVGFKADRENYLNDCGRQVRLLGESVSSHYMAIFNRNEEFPEEGYHGEYVKEIARDIADEHGNKFIELEKKVRTQKLADIALKEMIRLQKEIMDLYRVNFQTWFPESNVRDTNKHLEVLDLLKQRGYTFEQDGATWFQSSKFGDEKDRVLLTQENEPTYFLVDIAYHQTKYERGYKKMFDIWGPDHHGYVPRMKAALQALGYPQDSFDVEIVQQVNLLRGGEAVKMSKRAGQIIEMKEVIDEVGVDAARFFFVNRKSSSHLDFDIDLAKKETDENPVYYVQYAHARICNIIKFAGEQGIIPDDQVDLNLLVKDEEKQLIKKLLQYPDVISGAAQSWEPHRLTTYLQELAATFHRFYHFHRVVSEDKSLSKARLTLTKATKIVLANGFKILGISAPENM